MSMKNKQNNQKNKSSNGAKNCNSKNCGNKDCGNNHDYSHGGNNDWWLAKKAVNELRQAKQYYKERKGDSAKKQKECFEKAKKELEKI